MATRRARSGVGGVDERGNLDDNIVIATKKCSPSSFPSNGGCGPLRAVANVFRLTVARALGRAYGAESPSGAKPMAASAFPISGFAMKFLQASPDLWFSIMTTICAWLSPIQTG